MFKRSHGAQLTSEQVQELDDSFFESRPFEYFQARISALISSASARAASTSEALGLDFASTLGLAGASGVLSFDASDRELQVATDSFALRHHVAEALVRLYEGLLTTYEPGGVPKSVWASIADGPDKTILLVNRVSAHLSSQEGAETFWSLVLPPSAAEAEPGPDTVTALNVMGSWLQHAMNLLVRDDVNINAAHNKVKHGLAVRSRNNLRLTLTTTPPNDDGTVPLSGLTGPDAIDLFDTVTLDCLARPPKQRGHRQGLEMSTLRLSAATLLAEAWMISITYGAMFRVAADRHFCGRQAELSPYPRLPLGPTPDQVLANSVVGTRQVVTTPPGGGETERKAGIAFHEAFLPLDINFDAKWTGTVVEG
ncbi:hypothetical protein QF050_003141 [Arthrobacter sp. SLBN-112]|nr:hypothetical protein [Arthrobacter sp. SLBN-112]